MIVSLIYTSLYLSLSLALSRSLSLSLSLSCSVQSPLFSTLLSSLSLPNITGKASTLGAVAKFKASQATDAVAALAHEKVSRMLLSTTVLDVLVLKYLLC
jgi:hypothetical protein